VAGRGRQQGRRPGTFADTTFIQRVNTTGGLAPAPATCTANTIGTQSEVSYTADYHFWKAKGCSRSDDWFPPPQIRRDLMGIRR
jgi:hypothetical protein